MGKIVNLILIMLLVSFVGCGEVEEFIDSIGEEVTDPVNDSIDDAIDDVEGTPPEVTPEPETVGEQTNFYTEDNCGNPPKEMNVNNNAKCQGSATRGGTIVCIIPYRFTWPPYKNFIDHHGVTMKCNLNDDHFTKVQLVLKNGTRITLDWDKCQNYVATNNGFIGRQHFRNEQFLWDNVKKKVELIEMKVNGQKTCLKFA